MSSDESMTNIMYVLCRALTTVINKPLYLRTKPSGDKIVQVVRIVDDGEAMEIEKTYEKEVSEYLCIRQISHFHGVVEIEEINSLAYLVHLTVKNLWIVLFCRTVLYDNIILNN